MVIEKINAKEEKMFVNSMKVHLSKFTCYKVYKHLNSIIKDAILLFRIQLLKSFQMKIWIIYYSCNAVENFIQDFWYPYKEKNEIRLQKLM